MRTFCGKLGLFQDVIPEWRLRIVAEGNQNLLIRAFRDLFRGERVQTAGASCVLTRWQPHPLPAEKGHHGQTRSMRVNGLMQRRRDSRINRPAVPHQTGTAADKKEPFPGNDPISGQMGKRSTTCAREPENIFPYARLRMRVVNKIFVPHHAVPKPPRGHAEFHRDLETAFISPFVLLVAKCFFENPGIEDFAQKIMPHDPLIMPRDDAAGLLKQASAGVLNLSAFQTFKRPVMELQESDMKLRDDEILVLPRVAHQGDALGIAR